MPRVKVYRNSANFGEPRLILIEGSLDDFISAAGKKLSLKNARLAYTKTGVEITAALLNELAEDEEVFISEGEPFWKTEGKPGVYKIALLGVGGVGKSCITLKYIKGAFSEIYDPSIEDAFRHQVTCDDIPCVLEVLDTAGQEEYKCTAQQWVQKKNGFLLVYSIIDNLSFAQLGSFYDLIVDEYENVVEYSDGMPPIVLVGNKLDLERNREVPTASGEAQAVKWNARFLESSAKTNENVEKVFHTLIRMMRQRHSRRADGNGGIGSARRKLCFFL